MQTYGGKLKWTVGTTAGASPALDPTTTLVHGRLYHVAATHHGTDLKI